MIRILFVMLAVMMVSGCERKGPMERTGERLDEIGENIKEGESPLKKKGPMEKAGEAIDDSVEGNKK
jgi:hypothetical protein